MDLNRKETVRIFYYYILILLFVITLPVFANEPVSGVHYRVIDGLRFEDDKEPITVTEYFWYGCFHCYRLEPRLQTWLDQQDREIIFKRVPALIRSDWELHANAYYTALSLNIFDDFHQSFFDAIHSERRQFNDIEQLEDFFQVLGVDSDRFHAAINSAEVKEQVEQAKVELESLGIHTVPSIVINDQFVSDAGMSRGLPGLVQLISYLVAKLEN